MSKTPWTLDDTIATYKQGWAPFTLDDGDVSIQKLDDPEAVAADYGFTFTGTVFKSDSDAYLHVLAAAAKGDDLAIRALQLTGYHQYVVDGYEFDDLESCQLGDGKFAPFMVFDTFAQDYLPTKHKTRKAAQRVADRLNSEAQR